MGDDLRLRSFGCGCLWVGLIVCSLLFRLFDVVLVGFYSFVGVFGCWYLLGSCGLVWYFIMLICLIPLVGFVWFMMCLGCG